jgi:hypothetical protein
MVQQPLARHGLTIGASRSHSDTPHSVGLLWASHQPYAETSTWQHTTLSRDRHPRPGRIRTRNPKKRAAAGPRLRPRGHQSLCLVNTIKTGVSLWKDYKCVLQNVTSYRLSSRKILNIKSHIVHKHWSRHARKKTPLQLPKCTFLWGGSLTF